MVNQEIETVHKPNFNGVFSSPTKMKTEHHAKRTKIVTDKIGLTGPVKTIEPDVIGLTSMNIENGKNGAEIAFKNHVDKIVFR